MINAASQLNVDVQFNIEEVTSGQQRTTTIRKGHLTIFVEQNSTRLSWSCGYQASDSVSDTKRSGLNLASKHVEELRKINDAGGFVVSELKISGGLSVDHCVATLQAFGSVSKSFCVDVAGVKTLSEARHAVPTLFRQFLLDTQNKLLSLHDQLPP